MLSKINNVQDSTGWRFLLHYSLTFRYKMNCNKIKQAAVGILESFIFSDQTQETSRYNNTSIFKSIIMKSHLFFANRFLCQHHYIHWKPGFVLY